MMFFRTIDRRRDRSIIENANLQRRQQRLAQQHMQEVQKAALTAADTEMVAE